MTINFTVQSTPVKIIKQGDPDFTFTSGLTFCTRAGVEISNNCPTRYREIITTALAQGWVKPFVVMKESEYMWVQLGEEKNE